MRRTDTVIIGFTKARGRRDTFAALVLGCFDEGLLSYCGLASSGFGREKASLYERLMRLRSDTSPFPHKLSIKSKIVWLKPLLIAEIMYDGTGRDGRYKNIKFVGLKASVSASDVHKRRR